MEAAGSTEMLITLLASTIHCHKKHYQLDQPHYSNQYISGFLFLGSRRY